MTTKTKQREYMKSQKSVSKFKRNNGKYGNFVWVEKTCMVNNVYDFIHIFMSV